MDRHEIYMARAIELAKLGTGNTSPNPLVGCVIVKNDIIIGEGWHKKYGEAHAEVNAINAVKNKADLTGASVYVSLEPCAHHGKTPPCVDLLLQFPLAAVYISSIDPNPLVSGKGIEKLIANGISVEVGILEKEGTELNKRFFTYVNNKRPYIILKWAETRDGFIAKENKEQHWISGNLSKKLVHKWRAEEDAIMVGTNTALFDNPQLNVREWEGKNPTRVLIDKNLQVPSGAHLFDGTQTTICYNYQKQEVKNLVEYVKIDPAEDLAKNIIDDLYDRKIQSIIVEGGAVLLSSLIQLGLWDEARIFRCNEEFGIGIESPVIRGVHRSTEKIGPDELLVFTRN